MAEDGDMRGDILDLARKAFADGFIAAGGKEEDVEEAFLACHTLQKIREYLS